MLKRLRRIRDAKSLLLNEFGINVTYYWIKNLAEKGIIKGIRFGKTIYIYYDDLIRIAKEIL